MMKVFSFVSMFLFLLSMSLVLADDDYEHHGDSGAIWITENNCGNESQDVDHYNIGESVYVNGENFEVGETYDWEIKGSNGGGPCDPDKEVAKGEYTVDTNGDFCFDAYIINFDDCGKYEVEFGDKHDYYKVREIPMVPEFGFFIGMLTILAAIGIFFVVRRD